MDKEINKLKKKYGYIIDIELGEIPLLSNNMTKEERTLVENYINELINRSKK